MHTIDDTTPFPGSYWVVPGMLLAGEFPGDQDQARARQKTGRLIDCGILKIINLMEADETDHSEKLFNAYEPIAMQVASEKKLPIECHRFPIADLGVPTISQMISILDKITVSIADKGPVYVHCRGGIGRTGTVVGCYLLQNRIASPADVFDVIADLRRHDRKKHLVSPETDAQRHFVSNWLGKEKVTPTRHSRTVGCLIGGGVGDALGAPVEFMRLGEIRDRYGKAGISRFESAYGRKGAITDDTQMMLFTAEGLILSRVRAEYGHGKLTIPAIYHAYLRWLYTQEIHLQADLIKNHGSCSVIDGILTGHRELFSQRAPGNSCLSSLRSGKMGTMDQPINDSKGCGGVMRVAPIGLAHPDAEKAFQIGCESAAITHGHPTGYLAAGFLAAVISMVAFGEALDRAIADASHILVKRDNHDECLKAVESAVDLSQRKSFSPEILETLGAGWVAEEALAIGLYCALVADRDFRRGVLLAVNHSGDSDSTGAITGNLIGAQSGIDGIPNEWLSDLELRELIEEVADDMINQFLIL